MDTNVPFPRLVFGTRDLFRSIAQSVKQRPLKSALSVVLLLILLGGTHVVGLRRGFEQGYVYSLSTSGLRHLRLTMGQLQYLEAQDSTSLHYSLDVDLDGRILDTFLFDDLKPAPWYSDWDSKQGFELRMQSYRSTLTEVALYRRDHPTKVINGKGLADRRLNEFLSPEMPLH
ncbi:MAG: hypothetical protein H8E18_05440 [FCB group bacterium]|nr:hypothetical protein [FCB group bacterium]